MANFVTPVTFVAALNPAGLRDSEDVDGNKTTVPTYAAGLASFAVRLATGAYAPSGAERFYDLVSTDWKNNDPGATPESIYSAWSGGTQFAAEEFEIEGGGHNDTAYNGKIICDASADASGVARGFRVIPNTLSAVADVRVDDTYLDGKMCSIHTYNGLTAGYRGGMWRVGGAKWDPAGAGSNKLWHINTRSGFKRAYADSPTGGYFYCVVNGDKLLRMTHTSGQYAFFDRVTNQWTAALTLANSRSIPGDAAVAYDTTRGLAYMFANGTGEVVNPNWGAMTAATVGSSLTFTGDTGIVGLTGCSAFYDAAGDDVWVFGGHNYTSDRGYTHIARIDAADIALGGSTAVVETALTGGSMVSAFKVRGSYGRFAWMPARRQIAFAFAPSDPMAIIQLPAAA